MRYWPRSLAERASRSGPGTVASSVHPAEIRRLQRAATTSYQETSVLSSSAPVAGSSRRHAPGTDWDCAAGVAASGAPPDARSTLRVQQEIEVSSISLGGGGNSTPPGIVVFSRNAGSRNLLVRMEILVSGRSTRCS